MPATVHCPKCDTPIALMDFQLGQKIVCPSCQRSFTAEAPPEPVAKRRSKVDDVAEMEATRRARDADRPTTFKRHGGYRLPDRGVLVLVLGILSVVFGLLGCLPFALFPPIGLLIFVSGLIAVPTLILGFLFMRQIDAGERDPAGKVQNVIGLVCGVVSVVIFLLALLLFCLVLSAAGGPRRRRAELPVTPPPAWLANKIALASPGHVR